MPYQVMAAAMAKRGQIKLFGDTPTIAEATLARARKRVFYDERYAAAFPEHKLYLCSFCKGWLLLLSEKFDNFVLRFLLLEAGTHLERCSFYPCIAVFSLKLVVLGCTLQDTSRGGAQEGNWCLGLLQRMGQSMAT
jgi:hypothetical protein